MGDIRVRAGAAETIVSEDGGVFGDFQLQTKRVVGKEM